EGLEMRKPDLPPEERNQRLRQRRDALRRSAGALQKVEAILIDRQKGKPLSADDEATLLQASFYAADCSFYLGDYNDAIRRYQALERRYAKQVGQLQALLGLWKVYHHWSEPLSA